MVSLVDRPEVLGQGDDLRQRWSWAAMLVAVLVSLAVGLGVGWWAFASDERGQATQAPETETQGQVADYSTEAAKQEALSIINAYVAAWNLGDGRGVVSLMSEFGMVVVSSEYGINLQFQMTNATQRRELIKMVRRTEGLYGEQHEVADVWWIGLSDNRVTGGVGGGGALVLISGRYATPVNPFYDEAIRFAFYGDQIASVEINIPGLAEDFPDLIKG